MSSDRPIWVSMPKPPNKCLKQLVNNANLSDVTFKVGSKLIHAHKLIITMASEVFDRQFNGSFAEATGVCNRDNPVVIKDIEPEIFLMLMNYIYCDEIELTSHNVTEIWYASQKYLLQKLTERCEAFWKSWYEAAIDETNALTMLYENQRHKVDYIDRKCLTIIRDNPLKYFKLEAFLKLNRLTMEKIAVSETMNCSKDQLQEAIDNWRIANGSNEAEIIPMLEGCQCCTLTGYSSFIDMKTYSTCLKVHTERPFKLYGVGIFVGMYSGPLNSIVHGISSYTNSTVHLNISIEGPKKVFVSKKFPIPTKGVLHTYPVFFERMTVVNSVIIKVESVNLPAGCHMFGMKEFIPARGPLGGDLTVYTHRARDGQQNCIAYLLYNL